MGMNHERCTVCEHYGKIRVGHNLDLIFQKDGKQKVIPLCWSHSVELFKIGQKVFLTKYEGSLASYHLDSNVLYEHFPARPVDMPGF